MATMLETRHHFPKEKRAKIVDLLNVQLANVFDLYSQTKQAHWNVRGMNFSELHALFDELAASIFPFIDDLAERANALGGVAFGTVSMSAKGSELDEFPATAGEGLHFVDTLADRYATVAKSMRDALRKAEELEDADTADLFTNISRVVDKSLWFLEAHLQQGKGK